MGQYGVCESCGQDHMKRYKFNDGRMLCDPCFDQAEIANLESQLTAERERREAAELMLSSAREMLRHSFEEEDRLMWLGNYSRHFTKHNTTHTEEDSDE